MNVDNKFSATTCLWNTGNLHQLCLKSKGWKAHNFFFVL